ncbi:YhcN/YlaJ family sporulation lipoprotein [Microaerobacter geothermalis]|uniref:YhcN/YlaJ family sporulation lipoprotein n=1 Tax=Microaerobacter geothermalis TaxID=674972 RepID=UPI001F37AD3D|nr:YhcN/YlaJ family sporulation lipoprotein [Microaerobacter geothermalis]MCF6093555.1 YhcN/YlaJ family sporulation lipoprotein [Microaerobacter geothermalis]
MLYKTLVISFLTIMILGGCQPANNPPANQSAPKPEVQNIKDKSRVQQTAPRSTKSQNAQDTAERLAHLATKIPQVNDATAVVAGKYAIVGIDVDANLDRSRVGTIKYAVAEALKEDPQGANVLVTADADTVQRIRELAQDIRNGRPVAGIAEELADIAGRLMLQPSKQVKDREEPPNQNNQRRINE